MTLYINASGSPDAKMLSAIPRGFTGAQLQLGCVVRNLDAAMSQWSTLLGVGPWIVFLSFPDYDFIYRGQNVEVEISAAFSYFGEIQVELIHQHNAAPSPYHEFLAAGHEGLQHFGFFTPDFAGSVRSAIEANMKATFFLGPKGAANMTIYFELPGSAQPMIEIVELTPARETLFSAIKRPGIGWDGSQPVRRYNSAVDFMASLAVA